MLRSIAKLVDCKKQVIVSAVRLETVKKPRDFLRESFAATPYAAFEVSGGFTEGEVNVIDGQVGKPRNGNSGHFECGPQVLNCVDCVLCKADWERSTEFELMPFVDAIRIRLDDTLAWCPLEINSSAPFKIGKVLICPLES